MVIKYKDGREFQLIFDADMHSYKVDGEKVPSVTKVIDACFPKHLTDWAVAEGADFFKASLEPYRLAPTEESGTFMLPARVVTHIYKGIQTAYKSIGRDAAEIGTVVHNWIESAIKFKMVGGSAPKVPKGDEINNCIKAYKAWSRERKPVWLASERKIYYHDPGGVNCYAGTVDALAEIDDKLCVIDFKTSKKIYKPYHLQVAAYSHAIATQDDIDVPMAMILRFDKETGQFQEKLYDPKPHMPMFFHCLDLKAWNTARIKHEG